jgi:hypothetical protein
MKEAVGYMTGAMFMLTGQILSQMGNPIAGIIDLIGGMAIMFLGFLIGER